jgi:hypothetical protein
MRKYLIIANANLIVLFTEAGAIDADEDSSSPNRIATVLAGTKNI